MVFSAIVVPLHKCGLHFLSWLRAQKIAPELVPPRKPPDKIYHHIQGTSFYLLKTKDNPIFDWLRRVSTRMKTIPSMFYSTIPPVSTDNTRITHVRNMVHEIIAMTTSSSQVRQNAHEATFDSDSEKWLVDTGSTHNISTSQAHFDTSTYTALPPNQVGANGVGGSSPAVGSGAISFDIHCDDGLRHTIHQPGAYHVPAAPLNMFDPMTWAKHRRQALGDYNCGVDVQAFKTIMYWTDGDRRYTKTLHHDANGLCFLHTTPGFSQFNHFAVHTDVQNYLLRCHPVLIPNDDDETGASGQAGRSEPSDDTNINDLNANDDDPPRTSPIETDFQDEPNQTPTVIEEEPLMPSDQRLLMQTRSRII